ncbi:MAG: DUF493 family protein, partial [Fulvivirga sp.]|nr:DUF493 family protein [Fulvivirga sp.]
ESFREKLNKEYEWPSLYTFKFIVRKGQEDEVKAIFSNHEVNEKHSRQGNYISITAKVMAESSDRVIDYYIEANKIDGILAL